MGSRDGDREFPSATGSRASGPKGRRGVRAPRFQTDVPPPRRQQRQCRLNGTPRAFAYPNGKPTDYTSTVTRLVREAGFACAVTTQFGVNGRDTSPYELRRGGPWEHDLPMFALKLAWYRASDPSRKPA